MTVEDKTARRAKIKLVLASVIALLFMIGEVLGKGSHHRTDRSGSKDLIKEGEGGEKEGGKERVGWGEG